MIRILWSQLSLVLPRKETSFSYEWPHFLYIQWIVRKFQTKKQTGTLYLCKAVRYLECLPFLEKVREGRGPIAPMCSFVAFFILPFLAGKCPFLTMHCISFEGPIHNLNAIIKFCFCLCMPPCAKSCTNVTTYYPRSFGSSLGLRWVIKVPSCWDLLLSAPILPLNFEFTS